MQLSLREPFSLCVGRRCRFLPDSSRVRACWALRQSENGPSGDAVLLKPFSLLRSMRNVRVARIVETSSVLDGRHR